MNLIEKLGLEKCKQIVCESSGGNEETHYCTHVEDYINSIYDGTCPHCILIYDIKTAIVNHNTDSFTDIKNHISPLTVVIEK